MRPNTEVDITASEICIILHIIRKMNLINALSFIQNIAKF